MAEKFVKTKKEVGFVVSTQDYLVNLEGLPSAKINDIVTTKSGGRALVSALSKNTVEALMLDPERPKPGDYFEMSGGTLTLPLGVNMFGRVINPLGVPLDGKSTLPPGGDALDLDTVAPGIDGREVITRQFYTGITIVDTLLPIGRGQRELVLCEPRSGKEAFFLDVILSLKGKGVVCIYAAIGRSEVEVKRFAEDIENQGASEHTIIVAATSNESAPMIIIVPAVASSLAEYYRNSGKDVLLILDDLATHAKYSREISLLAGRVPGRESYPADIFYQHSSQLERGGSFNEGYKNGAITLLPTIEVNIESFTNLIPTNVMSITDGHLLFSAALRSTGAYPAIEVDRSVTRVGRQTQMFIHKQVSDKVRGLIADFRELEKYARFGSELSTETQLKLKRGKITEELIKQAPLSPIHYGVQIQLLALVFAGFYDEMDEIKAKEVKGKLVKVLTESEPFKSQNEKMKETKLDDLIKLLTDNKGILEAACQQ
jgi:F-type H+-transporting ATPase subunit alpha